MAKKKNPTEKQKVFAREIQKQLADGKKPNATAAASVAYPTNNPAEMGHKAMKSEIVKREIVRLLDNASLTDQGIAWKLNNLTDSDVERVLLDALEKVIKLNDLYPDRTSKNLHVHAGGDDFLDKLAQKYEEH